MKLTPFFLSTLLSLCTVCKSIPPAVNNPWNKNEYGYNGVGFVPFYAIPMNPYEEPYEQYSYGYTRQQYSKQPVLLNELKEMLPAGGIAAQLGSAGLNGLNAIGEQANAAASAAMGIVENGLGFLTPAGTSRSAMLNTQGVNSNNGNSAAGYSTTGLLGGIGLGALLDGLPQDTYLAAPIAAANEAMGELLVDTGLSSLFNTLGINNPIVPPDGSAAGQGVPLTGGESGLIGGGGRIGSFANGLGIQGSIAPGSEYGQYGSPAAGAGVGAISNSQGSLGGGGGLGPLFNGLGIQGAITPGSEYGQYGSSAAGAGVGAISNSQGSLGGGGGLGPLFNGLGIQGAITPGSEYGQYGSPAAGAGVGGISSALGLLGGGIGLGQLLSELGPYGATAAGGAVKPMGGANGMRGRGGGVRSLLSGFGAQGALASDTTRAAGMKPFGRGSRIGSLLSGLGGQGALASSNTADPYDYAQYGYGPGTTAPYSSAMYGYRPPIKTYNPYGSYKSYGPYNSAVPAAQRPFGLNTAAGTSASAGELGLFGNSANGLGQYKQNKLASTNAFRSTGTAEARAYEEMSPYEDALPMEPEALSAPTPEMIEGTGMEEMSLPEPPVEMPPTEARIELPLELPIEVAQKRSGRLSQKFGGWKRVIGDRAQLLAGRFENLKKIPVFTGRLPLQLQQLQQRH